jgi:glycosyltransferase involved in cell wall biosynthesis
LKLVLKSLQYQTFQDWEALIIGDQCSDETEETVLSLRENKFKFLNLDKNFGDQAGPNSIGSRLAKGKYIAYLNHDDYWFPDHLEKMVSVLERKKYDLLIAHTYRINQFDKTSRNKFLASIQSLDILGNFSPVGGYSLVASSWLIKAELVHKVGDWTPASRVRYASSQEFLYRCWLSGAHIGISSARTVVIVPSLLESNSYLTSDETLHVRLFPYIISNDKRTLDNLVTIRQIGYPYKISQMIYGWRDPTSKLKVFIKNRADFIYSKSAWLVCRLGMSPWEYATFLLGLQKGDTKKILNRGRGLEVS